MTGEEAVADLMHIAHGQILNDLLKMIVFCVLDNPKFALGYGAAVNGEHGHHAYKGGLAVHTLEVTQICQDMIDTISLVEVNSDILLTAAICHDFCKIYDYDENGHKTEYRKLIRHLSGSYAWFVEKAKYLKLSEEASLQIQHCILAHHGRKEWGSPVEPQTVEASILHYADMLSMQYGVGR